MDLTASERRGALVLLAIFALGAARDLWTTRAGAPAPPQAPPSAVASGPVALAAGEPVGSPPARGRNGTDALAPLDLNLASAAELDALPGVGPVLAGRIVAYRREHGGFRAVDELMAVRGIGARSFARLRPWVRLSGPAESAAPAARARRGAAPQGSGLTPAARRPPAP